MAEEQTKPATASGNGGERPLGELRALRGLLRFLKPYKWVVAGAFIALVTAAGATLAIGQALRHMIDLGVDAENASLLDQYFGALLVVALLLSVATFWRFYLVSWLGERIVADMRGEVFSHLIGLSPAFFDRTRSGEIQSRLTADTTLIQAIVGSTASIAVRNLLLLVGATVLLAITSLALMLQIVSVVFLVIVPLVFFGRRVRRLSRSTQDRIADVGAEAGEALNAIQTVQAFTREDTHRVNFRNTVEGAFKAAMKRVHARAWLIAVVILLVFVSIDVMLWAATRDVTSGGMSGGSLAAFIFYSVIIAGSMGALSDVYGDFQRAAGATERLMELLAEEPDIKAPESPVALPQPARGELVMESVTFHYPSRPEAVVLNDFSLAVKPGETVALAGPSGAGKSTVFQLMLRFYDPRSGSIKIDGVDLTRARPGDVRERLAIVHQDPVLFAASISENIRYGRPDASDDEVRAAADAAVVTEFIDALPDGFNTNVGERGAQLSGGQRQRVAIARAILRNPAILLLDEATSALDAENERLVQTALERLMAERTTMVIAHRLATVLQADRIVVIDGGRVVATGGHEELVAQGGLYARLAELQFTSNGVGGGVGGGASGLSASARYGG